jgi:hypothetical protein
VARAEDRALGAQDHHTDVAEAAVGLDVGQRRLELLESLDRQRVPLPRATRKESNRMIKQ